MNLLNKLAARRASLPPLALGLALGASAGLALAAVVYVAADRLDIVEKKRSVARVVTTVDRNTALTVIAKEGPWYKVEAGGKQGYAYETAVSSTRGAKGRGIALSKVKPGRIEELEQAAAVRGLDEGARAYASASGLSTDGVEELFRRSGAIQPTEFDRFMSAGGLRGAEAAAQAAPSPTAGAPAVASTK